MHVVVSGPSGAGKSTLVRRLSASYPGKLAFSVSQYDFSTLVEDDAFVEHTKHYGNSYGTTFEAVEVAMKDPERMCVLDVDSVGVKNVKLRMPHAGFSFVFICPPSLAVLQKRLEGRGTESADELKERMDRALDEVAFAAAGAYDCIVVNDDLDRAYSRLRDFILEEKPCNEAIPASLLEAAGGMSSSQSDE